MFKYLLPVIFSLTSLSSFANGFTTEGNSLRNIELATINNKDAYYLSELDGAISAYYINGEKIWRQSSKTPAVLFEINVVDLNNDGNDDVVAASADGNIYAYNSNGQLLWQFNPGYKVRFSEVAIVNNGSIQVFAGGNDQKLYELNNKGELVSTTPIKGTVRTIASGKFIGNSQQLYLMTYAHDKYRWQFMGIIDPNSKKVLTEAQFKNKQFKAFNGVMVTDVHIKDIDDDGFDDVMLFGDTKFKAFYATLNNQLNLQHSFTASNKQSQRYAHSQGEFISDKQEIILRHGSIFYRLNNKGKLLDSEGKRYRGNVYNDFAYNPKTKVLSAAGIVGGGNHVYQLDTSSKNWLSRSPKVQGRMVEVENNLATLYQQALDFEMPSYQSKANKPWIMTGQIPNKEIADKQGNDIQFIRQFTWSEKTDRSALIKAIGADANKRDKRKKYDLSRKQIIAKAKELEKSKQPFILWAGHVTDPFYLHIDTMEAILEAAPNTCYGFLYAEMHNVNDPRTVHWVKEYVPRLAKAIRKKGKAKLYFRYKNVFWGVTSHLSPWKEVFHSGDYADVLVPASEDTSSRTQDINLSGRVGMLMTKSVNDFAMRLIDDNPTSWRPLSPGGQSSVSPFLRQGALMAAYGARFGINQAVGFYEDGHKILYALMKSGALPLVETKDILSIGSWHLINGVDDKLIHSIDDHHNVKQYKKSDDDAVISVAQMHWAGANIPEHDYSKALGVNYRWLNYLPEMPYGMIPIASNQYQKQIKTKYPYTVSDAKYGYLDNQKINGKDFGNYIIDAAKQGASKLPVVVEGAAWSAIRLDDNHIRVIMADPGYIDPQERQVTLRFNGKTPKQAKNILTKETLSITKNGVQLKVPAGSLSFVDLSY